MPLPVRRGKGAGRGGGDTRSLIPGLDPGTQLLPDAAKDWVPGSSPGMRV
ncbi:hypothetical protein GCM10017643_33620 [Ancylobacter dichloromethanicus]|uniref:Uncharacterized protein n=1 Tax=Ancylobacter dichloromethanicus TaxID=518825 RepID=A0A9W6J984_9HYPH|nr:hypothetical protein GCM10017643_33620 [Ancylobacter dichloromethanicus]